MRSNLWISVLVALSGSACTLGPTDGMRVTSTTGAVSFGGFDPHANSRVEIQAFNPGTGAFTGIASATSISAAYVVEGTELFPWSAEVVVPHWMPGTTGSVARLRMQRPDGRFLYTFRPDWSTCRAANPRLSDFLSRCSSRHSPELFLYTTDFPTSTDLVVSSIRRGPRGITVVVRNGGLHGIVTRIECSRFGGAIASVSHDLVPSAQGREFEIGLTAATGQTVTCTVFGTNEDGTPERSTGNNTLSTRIV
ncbi:MAG: hypothetical protein ACJ8GN_31110 [Longimicrobiaceae bacterium]